MAFAALLVLFSLPRTQDNATLDYWERLLSWPSVALVPAYLGWLVYRFATSTARAAVASVLVHTVVLSVLVIGAVQLANAVSDLGMSRVAFVTVVGLAAIAAIALLWPRRSSTSAGRRVFGVADVAAGVIAAVVYGFANYAMSGPGGSLPPPDSRAGLAAISLFTVVLTVLVLGAAVGVLFGPTRPALTSTLRISAGVLLLVCCAATALAVAPHVFT